MKMMFVIMIGLMFLSSCATTQKVPQNQRLFVKINSLEQQLKEQQNQNQKLKTQLAQLTEKETVEKNKPPAIELIAKTKNLGEKETPQPIAPIRPVIMAYIGQQIASGPHVIAIKNASKYIWGSFEINSRPVIFVRNGFPNTYPTDQGIVTLLPPGEVAYLILDNISGSTLIKAKSYTGVATPLKFQRERKKNYDFNARAEPYQRSIWNRWDF